MFVYSAELTCFDTCAALYTLSGIYDMRILDRTRNSIYGTFSCAGSTTAAFFGIYAEIQELLAYAGRTFFILNMCYVFVTEVTER